jgi:hypothetical protein
MNVKNKDVKCNVLLKGITEDIYKRLQDSKPEGLRKLYFSAKFFEACAYKYLTDAEFKKHIDSCLRQD